MRPFNWNQAKRPPQCRSGPRPEFAERDLRALEMYEFGMSSSAIALKLRMGSRDAACGAIRRARNRRDAETERTCADIPVPPELGKVERQP